MPVLVTVPVPVLMTVAVTVTLTVTLSINVCIGRQVLAADDTLWTALSVFHQLLTTIIGAVDAVDGSLLPAGAPTLSRVAPTVVALRQSLLAAAPQSWLPLLSLLMQQCFADMTTAAHVRVQWLAMRSLDTAHCSNPCRRRTLPLIVSLHMPRRVRARGCRRMGSGQRGCWIRRCRCLQTLPTSSTSTLPARTFASKLREGRQAVVRRPFIRRVPVVHSRAYRRCHVSASSLP